MRRPHRKAVATVPRNRNVPGCDRSRGRECSETATFRSKRERVPVIRLGESAIDRSASISRAPHRGEI